MAGVLKTPFVICQLWGRIGASVVVLVCADVIIPTCPAVVQVATLKRRNAGAAGRVSIHSDPLEISSCMILFPG